MLQDLLCNSEPVLQKVDVADKITVVATAVDELGSDCDPFQLQTAAIRHFSSIVTAIPSVSTTDCIQKSGQKNCTHKYKLCAAYQVCRHNYSNNAALNANVLQLNPAFLAAMEVLLGNGSVSAVDIQALSEMYGDAVATEAVIGTTATAQQLREFASLEDAQETAAALQAELISQYDSSDPRKGESLDGSGGDGIETHTDISSWIWKCKGTNFNSGDPRTLLAQHHNDPANWRILECTQFKSIFSLLSADMQVHCVAKFGHLVPMSKIHGNLDYTGLHKWDTESNCVVMHGRGTARWIAGSYVGQVYDGEGQDGKRGGLVVQMLPSGSRYDGAFLDDKRHGYGVFKWFDGDTYEGEWMNDKIHGTGAFRVTTGANYVGEWQQGNKHGQGVHTYAEGGSYDGAWHDDKRHGYGVRKYAGGESYYGDWMNGLRHGQGVNVWASGSHYSGEWQYNKRHGQGVQRYKSGIVREGR